MAYTKWQADWKNLPDQTTPIVEGFLDHVETALDTQDDRIVVLEYVPQNTQTVSYTLVLADAGKAVEINAAVVTNLTIPPNSSVAFPVGTVLEVVQLGAGQVTVVAGAGVTLRSPSGFKLRTQYSAAGLRKRTTDEWVVGGDVVV